MSNDKISIFYKALREGIATSVLLNEKKHSSSQIFFTPVI